MKRIAWLPKLYVQFIFHILKPATLPVYRVKGGHFFIGSDKGKLGVTQGRKVKGSLKKDSLAATKSILLHNGVYCFFKEKFSTKTFPTARRFSMKRAFSPNVSSIFIAILSVLVLNVSS